MIVLKIVVCALAVMGLLAIVFVVSWLRQDKP